MSEPVQIALLSAGAALIGIILGAIISPLTTLFIESRKRHWELDDQRMVRFLQLEEQRLGQIEAELLELVKCFDQIYHTLVNFTNVVRAERIKSLAAINDEIEDQKKLLSTRQDKIRVIIGSLDNEEIHDKWSRIDQECEKIIAVERELKKSIKDDHFSLPGELQTSFEASISELLSVLYSNKVRLGRYYEQEK